jgi:hypothetical protein
LKNSNWIKWFALALFGQGSFTISCGNPTTGQFVALEPCGLYSPPDWNGYVQFWFDDLKCGGPETQFFVEYVHDQDGYKRNGKKCNDQVCAYDNNVGYNYRISGPPKPSPKGWKGRSIYQLLTDRFANNGDIAPKVCNQLYEYCGGTWKGITRNLDYIQDMGFDAIWISPIVKNTPKGYHGYWTLDFYKVNENFGTEADLLNLIKEAKERDIYVMFDVVANHQGPWPSIESYPPPFNKQSNYHPYCTINDGSSQLENEVCRLFGDLPDLNTEDPATIAELYKWIGWLKNKYQPDALRIDTFRNVRADFWPGFIKSAGNIFSMGEAYGSNTSYIGSYQNYAQSVLSYPSYFNIFMSEYHDAILY